MIGNTYLHSNIIPIDNISRYGLWKLSLAKKGSKIYKASKQKSFFDQSKFGSGEVLF